MTIAFPRRLLTENSHSWNLVGVAMIPGQAAQPFAPIIRSDGGGYWSCTMTDVNLAGKRFADAKGRERQRLSTLLWRAVRQLADGGVVPIVVPRNDALFRPWPVGVAQSSSTSIPHSDDSSFSDDSQYYQSVIDIVTVGTANLRATSLDVLINVAGDLVGGEAFSIFHGNYGWRLYEIATVDYTDATRATITFNPPLREAVAGSTSLEFDRPRCMMRLATPSAMDLSVAPWTFNRASVSFVESPPSS